MSSLSLSNPLASTDRSSYPPPLSPPGSPPPAINSGPNSPNPDAQTSNRPTRGCPARAACPRRIVHPQPQRTRGGGVHGVGRRHQGRAGERERPPPAGARPLRRRGAQQEGRKPSAPFACLLPLLRDVPVFCCVVVRCSRL